MKSKNAIFSLVLFLSLLLAGMASAQSFGITSKGDYVQIINEDEKAKAAAIEERTKEMKRARESWETENAERRRVSAFNQAKKERRDYVRRIRGK